MLNINSYKGSNIKNNLLKNNNVIKTQRSDSGGLYNILIQNEFVLLMIGFFVLVIISVFVAAFFANTENYRSNILFNNGVMILVALSFIYVIYTAMGKKMTVLGKEFDVAHIYFVSICMFIIFIMG